MPSSQDETSILLRWLNLLGWQVDVELDGDNLVGVARHVAGSREVAPARSRPDERADRRLDDHDVHQLAVNELLQR